MMFHTRFDPIGPIETENTMESMTQQHFKDDCDINVLYKRFVKETGQDPLGMPVEYSSDLVDISELSDLQGAYEKMAIADDAFMQLDAQTRAKFDNDPRRAMEYFGTMSNEDLVKYGLHNRKLPEKGVEVNANPSQTESKSQSQDVPQDSLQNS